MLTSVSKVFKHQQATGQKVTVEEFIRYVEEINEPAFEYQHKRPMTQSEKDQAKEAKLTARTLVEVKNVIKSIIRQSQKYIRSDAYVIWRMASILNDQKEFDAFHIKKENEIRFSHGGALPSDSEIVAAITCGILEEAHKEYRHIFDYN